MKARYTTSIYRGFVEAMFWVLVGAIGLMAEGKAAIGLCVCLLMFWRGLYERIERQEWKKADELIEQLAAIAAEPGENDPSPTKTFHPGVTVVTTWTDFDGESESGCAAKSPCGDDGDGAAGAAVRPPIYRTLD